MFLGLTEQKWMYNYGCANETVAGQNLDHDN